MKPLGIIVQEIVPQYEIELEDFCYEGLSKYKTFPAEWIGDKSLRANVFNSIRRIVKTDEQGLLSYISNMSDYIEYMGICREQNLTTRSLFIYSDKETILWKGDKIAGTFIGYEFAYKNYVDPEFVYFLNKEKTFLEYKMLLNKYGLFNSETLAREFGKYLYSSFPYIEEEMPYSDTRVFGIFLI